MGERGDVAPRGTRGREEPDDERSSIDRRAGGRRKTDPRERENAPTAAGAGERERSDRPTRPAMRSVAEHGGAGRASRRPPQAGHRCAGA